MGEPAGKKVKIGVVGGGNVGLQSFQMFQNSSLAEVAYVVDRDTAAPAMVAARSAGVTTYTELDRALDRTDVDFVLEVTGSTQVLESIREKLHTGAEIISHGIAFIILKALEENRLAAYRKVEKDVVGVRDQIALSLNALAGFIQKIDKITDDLHYLALNAQIEASRAGEHGRGFAIVAEHVEASADFAKKIAREIDRVNADIVGVSATLDSSLKQLQ
jgi:methyl-accepting chemotaxis protein